MTKPSERSRRKPKAAREPIKCPVRRFDEMELPRLHAETARAVAAATPAIAAAPAEPVGPVWWWWS